jgi:hypothetical protein
MIDVNLLRSQGFLHLDAIPAAARGKFIESIESKKNGGTYSENIELGLSVLAEMGLSIEFLVKLHREVFYEPADPDSFYFIVRKVESGQSREAFRSHFDSHRFTIVVPLRVPNVGGELFHSSVRKEPRNALSNLAGKIFWKLFASRLGYKVVNLFSKIEKESFSDYRPLLFLGRSTLHGNLLHHDGPESRISVLLHFFDPEKGKGIGGLNRWIRRLLTR